MMRWSDGAIGAAAFALGTIVRELFRWARSRSDNAAKRQRIELVSAERLRRELLAEMRRELDRLREKDDEQEGEIEKLRAELDAASAERRRLLSENADLLQKVNGLERENARLLERVQELEKKH